MKNKPEYVWTNYNHIRELAGEKWVHQWLIDNYDSLKEKGFNLKTCVEEMKKELNLILTKENE